MKRIILLSIIFLMANLSDAMGAASDTARRLKPGQIIKAVEDKLVCAQSTTSKDRWSEEHVRGGKLYEYTKGADDKVEARDRHLVVV